MICLDASVLIAHFNPADPHHVAAGRLLIGNAAEPLCASALTLAEFYVQPARAAGTEALVVATAGIASLGVQRIPVDDPRTLAELRAKTGLKMPDCCVLDTALKLGARVATFDTALASAAERMGLALATP